MKKTTKIVIGIQARSNSVRLPRKVHMPLDGKPVLQHVIDSCTHAEWHNRKHLPHIKMEVWVLCPYDDEILQSFNCPIFDGPEDDVLKRYHMLATYTDCDYMVRVTGDCPLIPSFVISKIIKCIDKERDPVFKHYVSNVIERTEKEGFDVEIMSRELLNWLHLNRHEPEDREHVSIYIKRLYENGWHIPGLQFQRIHILDKCNQSSAMLSIDTQEDFDRVSSIIRDIAETKKRILARGDKFVTTS
jgi:spore coat polysaccharide biosynthesis protein SpsF (cytidylyltransferase family)